MLEGFVVGFAYCIALHKNLYGSAHVLNLSETGLAHHTLEHHSSSYAYLDRTLFECLTRLVSVLIMYILGKISPPEMIGIGLPLLPQF
ncbi:hypothetical protein MnTg03_00663 [bacterium MnTg03]|nr:hypothetical protein MnTg03_00663 [bacterium MnTg03]